MTWLLAPGNPMAKVLKATLLFQSIPHALAIAGMIQVDEVTPWLAAVAGGAPALLALAAAARLEKPGGQALGWATQVAGLALGLLTPWMYVMGAIFTLVYVITFVLGLKLEGAAPLGRPDKGENP